MDREQFVRMGILTEVALLVVAGVLDGIWQIPLEQNPLRTTHGMTNLGACLSGLAGGLVLTVFFWISWNNDSLPFRRIQEFVQDQLAPPLSQCRWWEIISIAAFAGIGEEILFRGVLQPRVGWLIATVLFGLAHSITPTYVVVAAVLGGLLGQLQVVTGNLWAPIIAHAVYDYVGFYLLISEYRRDHQSPPADQS